MKLRGSDIGIGSESHDDATVVLAGRAEVKKAMTDTRYFRLGTGQNSELRSHLEASLAGVQRPGLIYSDGEWYPCSIPEINENGNPVGGAKIDFAPLIETLNRLYEISANEDEENDSESQQ